MQCWKWQLDSGCSSWPYHPGNDYWVTRKLLFRLFCKFHQLLDAILITNVVIMRKRVTSSLFFPLVNNTILVARWIIVVYWSSSRLSANREVMSLMLTIHHACAESLGKTSHLWSPLVNLAFHPLALVNEYKAKESPRNNYAQCNSPVFRKLDIGDWAFNCELQVMCLLHCVEIFLQL